MNKPYIYDMNFVRKQSSKNLFNVVSLFAGGGGSSTGYRLAGGKVLGINEFIPAAQEVYHRNYPDTHIFTQDVRQLTGKMILDQFDLKKGELDILDGSPPCASFSAAGLREKGWGRIKKYSDSEQRTDDLFFEFVRILKEVQPKTFVAENVKGLTMGAAVHLLGSDQLDLFGKYKDTIYHSLVGAGYKVRFKVINAKSFGVPQSRPRIIFIGVRNDIDEKVTYPEGSLNHFTVGDAIGDLVNSEKEIQESTHSEGIVKNYVKMMKEGESGSQYAPSGYHGLIRVRRDKPSPTICARQGNKGACLLHWEDDRELTVSEIILLSSFPQDYYLGEKYTQKTERMGRAVPPLMMKAVAENIYETILKHL
tara:strand:- start:19089 stop:20183 length:1095 start_codon:yes stop_codon:yes gene_type:complete